MNRLRWWLVMKFLRLAHWSAPAGEAAFALGVAHRSWFDMCWVAHAQRGTPLTDDQRESMHAALRRSVTVIHKAMEPTDER